MFPGGALTLVGANSPAGLASRPIRLVLCDEVDRYPPSAGSEGDPIQLARKRANTFWNRKIVMVSTPTNKGASRIEEAFEDSDQRHYYVPCKHCHHEQKLIWQNVRWSEGDPGQRRMPVAHAECCGLIQTGDGLSATDDGLQKQSSKAWPASTSTDCIHRGLRWLMAFEISCR